MHKGEKGYLKNHQRDLWKEINDFSLRITLKEEQNQLKNESKIASQLYEKNIDIIQNRKIVSFKKVFAQKDFDFLSTWKEIGEKARTKVLEFLFGSSYFHFIMTCKSLYSEYNTSSHWRRRLDLDFNSSCADTFHDIRYIKKFYSSLHYLNSNRIFGTHLLLEGTEDIAKLALNVVDMCTVKGGDNLLRLRIYKYGFESLVLQLSHLKETREFTLWIAGYDEQKKKPQALKISKWSYPISEPLSIEKAGFLSEDFILIHSTNETLSKEYLWIYGTRKIIKEFCNELLLSGDVRMAIVIERENIENKAFDLASNSENEIKIQTPADSRLFQYRLIANNILFILLQHTTQYFALFIDLESKKLLSSSQFVVDLSFTDIWLTHSEETLMVFGITFDKRLFCLTFRNFCFLDMQSLNDFNERYREENTKNFKYHFGSFVKNKIKTEYCIVEIKDNLVMINLLTGNIYELIPKEFRGQQILSWTVHEELVLVISNDHTAHIANLSHQNKALKTSGHTLFEENYDSFWGFDEDNDVLLNDDSGSVIKSHIPLLFFASHSYLIEVSFPYTTANSLRLFCTPISFILSDLQSRRTWSEFEHQRYIVIDIADSIGNVIENIIKSNNSTNLVRGKLEDSKLLLTLQNLSLYLDFEYLVNPKFVYPLNKGYFTRCLKYNAQTISITNPIINTKKALRTDLRDWKPKWKKIPENNNRTEKAFKPDKEEYKAKEHSRAENKKHLVELTKENFEVKRKFIRELNDNKMKRNKYRRRSLDF